jgi:hypothetical protein
MLLSYHTHSLSIDLDHKVFKALSSLLRFQRRTFHETPLKAKSKRRFVVGLNEALKQLELTNCKAKLIICAVDIEDDFIFGINLK